MVEQDLSFQEPLASEVTAALIDLAQLAQNTASAEFDALGTIANQMLKRLLTLCAAQRGAVLLGLDEHLVPEQPSLPSPPSRRAIRALALHAMHEEEVHALLTTFPAIDTGVESAGPDLACWITYRLSTGEFLVEGEQSPQDVVTPPVYEVEPIQVKQPLQALLVLGWTTETDSECASAVERGHRLLPLVADAAGTVIVSILLAERIHELESVAVREELRDMELLKAELLGTVSHELRSPLASIKGYAATLLRHEHRLSREERHQFLLAINGASDRLEIIIERLLEMSELETGEVSIEPSPVDLAHLATEAIAAIEERVSAQFPDQFIFRLSLEHADGTPAHDVPLILADPRRLREVLDNLLENAVKYSPGGGAIKVIVRPVTQVQAFEVKASSLDRGQQSQMLEILVCDTGMGIPDEHLERIFDHFHRVDTRLTREVNGLGLGLAICKRIIEMHDGVIWAENGPNGKGSIFHVRLPIGELPIIEK